ncbi:MAG TPA: hypothetical protein GX506_07300 [Firmicutes bacterium]|nr:hypothetical protein [Bacillota bacterium]
MTVGELIKQLKQLDPKLQVVCYSEDAEIQAPGHSFRLFAIEGVGVQEVETLRAPDGTPTMAFRKTPESRPIVILEITCDF